MRPIKIFNTLITSILLIIVIPVYASVIKVNKDEANLVNELKQEGFKLDSTSEIVLSQKMQKNNFQNDGYYMITFACKHQKRQDKCILTGVKAKK